MKTMKSLACGAALALCAATAQAGCAAHVGRTSADPMALVATPSGPQARTLEANLAQGEALRRTAAALERRAGADAAP